MWLIAWREGRSEGSTACWRAYAALFYASTVSCHLPAHRSQLPPEMAVEELVAEASNVVGGGWCSAGLMWQAGGFWAGAANDMVKLSGKRSASSIGLSPI